MGGLSQPREPALGEGLRDGAAEHGRVDELPSGGKVCAFRRCLAHSASDYIPYNISAYLPADLAALIGATLQDFVFQHDMYDRTPMPNWNTTLGERGVVTLLGDAAHATTPHYGKVWLVLTVGARRYLTPLLDLLGCQHGNSRRLLPRTIH